MLGSVKALLPNEEPLHSPRGAEVVLANPVIHLYWAYALARAEE
jgi:hypothetical protein